MGISNGRKSPSRAQIAHAIETLVILGKFARYVGDLTDIIAQSLAELERLKTKSYNRKTPLPIDPFLDFLDSVDAEVSKAIRRGQFLDFRAGRVRWVARDNADRSLGLLAKTIIESSLREFYGNEFKFSVNDRKS